MKTKLVLTALAITVTTMIQIAHVPIPQALALRNIVDIECSGDGCYDHGYNEGLSNRGIKCPSGHSIAYCVGWDSGAGIDNRYLFSNRGYQGNYCECR